MGASMLAYLDPSSGSGTLQLIVLLVAIVFTIGLWFFIRSAVRSGLRDRESR